MMTLLPVTHDVQLNIQDNRFELTFKVNSRNAVDEYLSILEHYLAQYQRDDWPYGNPVRIMLVLNQRGMPPMTYLFERYVHFLVSIPNPPNVRLAVVYQRGFLLNLTLGFISLLPKRHHVSRAFFPMTDREKAIAWLSE